MCKQVTSRRSDPKVEFSDTLEDGTRGQETRRNHVSEHMVRGIELGVPFPFLHNFLILARLVIILAIPLCFSALKLILIRFQKKISTKNQNFNFFDKISKKKRGFQNFHFL